tara:strand:+ start:573 stop:719 length:147 start_codon:yes stop_codon:yes gene_type:complete
MRGYNSSSGAVAHQVYIEEGVGKYKNSNGAIIYNIRFALDREEIDRRL